MADRPPKLERAYQAVEAAHKVTAGAADQVAKFDQRATLGRQWLAAYGVDLTDVHTRDVLVAVCDLTASAQFSGGPERVAALCGAIVCATIEAQHAEVLAAERATP